MEQAIVIVRTNDMNERIEQLAEQCWVHTNEPLFGANSPHWEFDRQKFAELLIRECCDIIEEDGSAVLPLIIKKHFGITE